MQWRRAAPRLNRRATTFLTENLEMFAVAGEALIDFIAAADGRYRPMVGGAPFNFSRALALQGVVVSYLNPISSDVMGRLLRDTLVASGARAFGESTLRPTSLALVATSSSGQPSYQFYREGVADRALDLEQITKRFTDKIRGFHSGGLALVPPDHETILQAQQAAAARGIICTLDVNMRPRVAESIGLSQQAYAEAAHTAICGANIVKVSDEDLLHLGFSDAPDVAARSLLNNICKIVVLTLGEKGARLLTADHEIFQAAETVSVVDTVGAGDCFFAGFIAALVRDGSFEALLNRMPVTANLASALRHGIRCASMNITREGCQPPTWDDVVVRR
jgi:fructokinase